MALFAGLGEGSAFVAVTHSRREAKRQALAELDKLANRDPAAKVEKLPGVDFDTAMKLGMLDDFNK